MKATSGVHANFDGYKINSPKTDAEYRYYLHGPLARLELGDNKVQGVDYAYTLQGWLKGVNGHYLDASSEMGGDGQPGSPMATVARDAYAYALDYYAGDYLPIGGNNAGAFPLHFQVNGADTIGRDLFNGNISLMNVAIKGIGNGATVGNLYGYDQLNRLVSMRQRSLSPGATTWHALSPGQSYAEDIAYDANGNILTYRRFRGNGTEMDRLSYRYNRGTDGRLLDNRLNYVEDAVNDAAYGGDIETQVPENYAYDRVGNLVKDFSGGIDKISWTVYGKIGKITKSGGGILDYGYDAGGQRVSKAFTPPGEATKTTWYLREPSGRAGRSSTSTAAAASACGTPAWT
ncbi:hypothetical protein COR50_14120 [Chitinophaga caeni]|uniref:Type IV secretion protein Rhs n=1 Tax=Chitinophaga caeni TaxID=2029983 RepID=A0A291QW93_9BACT|nr:hypothetical protein [Chitinophaga caeni]ATL48207.1 hypothetical protein COR50_14120 [Chitinophaga caeni]